MEAVIFVGIQGSGKSTFYRERFFDTHVRINLDMLRTRHREKLLLEACLEAQQSFVVDNTNPARKDRRRYVEPARAAGFRVVVYYFESDVDACHERNRRREGDKVVPLPALRSTRQRLEPPAPDEGFDEIRHVRIGEGGRFEVEPWAGQY